MELNKQLHEQIPFAILILLTIITSIVVFTIQFRGKKKQQKRPPEPEGALPFIGHLHILSKNPLQHRTFSDMADKYGPIFMVRLGICQALVVSNWEIAKECFTTNDKVFPTRPKYLAAKLMAYNQTMLGFAPYGPYWRNIRKIATVELLSKRRLELLKNVRDTEINRFIRKLYQQSSRGAAVADMKEQIGDLAMNIIVRTIAGKSYEGSYDDESRRFQKALGDFFHLSGLFLVSDTVPFLGWLDVLMGRISKIKRTAKELDVVLSSWVNERRERMRENNIQREEDFIDVMLSILDDGDIPTDEADTTTKATCLSLILGGNDTTAITFTWALSLLLNNRHVLKQAQDELDTHVGKHRRVEESDINNLVYLQAIIKETLRLCPATPLSVPREAMEDCRIAGYHIPAGTHLYINLWKLQRDPSIWRNPLDFQPERFLSDQTNIDVRGQNFELIPFGSGRRICPGISFALQVLHLALARLLHGFELGTVTDSVIDMSERPGITVPRATPLEVTLTPRLPSMLYG